MAEDPPNKPKPKPAGEGSIQDPSFYGSSDAAYQAAIREAALQDQAERASMPKPEDFAKPTEPSWWSKLLHGVAGTSRLEEIARSVPRGAARAGAAMAEAAHGAVSAIAEHRFGAAGKSLVNPIDKEGTQEAIDLAYGKHSDDPLAAFAEGVTQVGVGLGAAHSMGITGFYATGAVVDAVAFDPYEAQLAELMAKAPAWSGVKQLGEALSVSQDDSEFTARFKRVIAGAGAGAIAGRIFEGIGATYKWMFAKKTGNAALTKEAEATLASVADATQTSEGLVNVRPTPDGRWTLEAPGGGAGLGPKFADRAEAEAQAGVLNAAVIARRTKFSGTTLTTEDAATVKDIASRINKGDDLADIEKALEGTHLNLSYANEPQEALAYIEAISERFQKELDSAAGTIPIARSMQITSDILGAMPASASEAAVVARKMLQSATGPAWHAKAMAAREVLGRLGKTLAEMSEVLDARPHDVIAHDEFKLALQNMYGLQERLVMADAEWGRTGRFMQERGSEELGKVQLGSKPAQAADAAAEAVPPKAASESVAGMTVEELRGQARMLRIANGDPAALGAVHAGAEVIRLRKLSEIAGDIAKGDKKVAMVEGGPKMARSAAVTGKIVRSALEVFTNFLLSGPTTMAKIAVSQTAVTGFEALARMGAGAVTWNKELAREGMDIAWANLKYLKDNMKAAVATIDAGHSIINPRPVTQYIGGTTGQAVRIPGSAIGVLDEFTKVSNYRAYMRAKSLRLGREAGLEGAALESRVADDLRNAFTDDGRARVPEAMAFAEKTAFSGPLQAESFGKAFTEMINNNIYSKFVVPFAKASFNIIDYAWEATPLLNMFNKKARDAILAGGEDAAVIHARSAMAGSLYAYALHKAMAGELSGRGPSNPELRKQWLLTHTPYSITETDLAGKKHNIQYNVLDPFAIWLGLVGDLHQIISETPDSREASDVAYATVAAIAANLSSKSYLTGVSRFADAWGSNSPDKTKRYLQDFAASMIVPNFITDVGRKMGGDPYFHEVRSMMDAIRNKLPSNGLVPRHDFMGRPVLRMIDPSSMPKNSVEDALLGLDKALPAMRTKIGLVDLLDKQLASKDQPVPYMRLMQLIREGFDGNAGMRDQMVDLVNSDQWKGASSGSELYPGGERWMRANARKNALEQRSFKKLREEYPKVDQLFRAGARAEGASIKNGEQGITDIETMFGVKLKAK